MNLSIKCYSLSGIRVVVLKNYVRKWREKELLPPNASELERGRESERKGTGKTNEKK